MRHSAMLTYRIHRFEVVFSAILLAMFAVWVWIVSQQMLDLDIPGTCWPRTVDGEWASPGCDALMTKFRDYQSGAGYSQFGLSLMAPVVGLLIGVPIVAREVELRTAELAWSLALRRGRWLLTRLVPMLALAIVGFVILGWLGERLFAALDVGRVGPDLMEVASFGPPLVARGLMTMGIGLLAGALVGRTLPALVIGAVVMLCWSLAAVPTIQRSMFAERAEWENQNSAGWHEGATSIAYLESGKFDTSQPGLNGEPGARLDRDHDLSPKVKRTCGPMPAVFDDSLEVQAYDLCSQTFFGSVHWDLTVPASAYGDFQAVEMTLGLVIGGLALLLTFPVVARRRPA
jgi:hypothetical protein